MKTIAQVVKEYKNRKNTPKYATYGVLTDDGEISIWNNVTNSSETYYRDGNLIEFDAYNKNEGMFRHVKIVGRVVRTEQFIDE